MNKINSHFRQVLKLMCIFAIAVLTLFGVQTLASASEGSTSGATALNDWGFTNLSSENGELETHAISIASDSTVLRVTMYRLYNKYTGEHFYTSNADEKASLVEAGWNDEGVGWYAPWFAISKSDSPVYRLYNSYAPGGDHHYTSNKSEYDSLKEEGWTQEGVGWYSVDGNDTDKIGVYRQYNPNAFSCNHNFTIDTEERDNLTKEEGWNDEGIGWYGYSSATPSIQELDFSKISVSTASKTYNGKAQTQTIKSSAYKQETDYTVAYSNNVNAGTATIVVEGKGIYTGSKTYEFTINKLDISNATVTLDDSEQFTYDKTEHEQKVIEVVANGITLTASDYTVSNNKQTNAGTYNLDVTGQGNFTGVARKEFNIAKRKLDVQSIDVKDKTYDGKTDAEVSVTVSSALEGDQIVASAKGTFADADAGNDKTVTVTASFAGVDGDNYETLQTTYSAKASILCKISFETNCKNGALNDASAKVGTSLSTIEGASSLSRSGLELQGWYTDEACSDGSVVGTESKEFVLGSTKVSGNTIKLYANWVPMVTGDEDYYWISPAMKCTTGNTKVWTKSDPDGADADVPNSNYVKAAWNVKKSSDEIRDDVVNIEMGDTDVIEEYKSFMNNDDYHLYTKWIGSTAEYGETSDVEHEANEYVEFRVIEVGSHNTKVEGTTSLTLQATHSLPIAAAMNSTATNKGGWAESALKTSLNNFTIDSIFSYFNTGFTSSTKQEIKYSTKGEGSSETGSSTNYFWILSRTEYSNFSEGGYSGEGSQYALFSKWKISDTDANPAIEYLSKTRNGGTPSGALDKDPYLWTRSPFKSTNDLFHLVGGGQILSNIDPDIFANVNYAVVPAFCF